MPSRLIAGGDWVANLLATVGKIYHYSHFCPSVAVSDDLLTPEIDVVDDAATLASFAACARRLSDDARPYR